MRSALSPRVDRHREGSLDRRDRRLEDRSDHIDQGHPRRLEGRRRAHPRQRRGKRRRRGPVMWPYLIAIGVLGAAGSLILGGALRGGDETPPPPTPTRHPSGARMRDPITTWAEQNRVHPSIPLAIRTVEAGRLPAVDPAGRPLIRFEAHVFIAQLRKAGVSEATLLDLARVEAFKQGDKPHWAEFVIREPLFQPRHADQRLHGIRLTNR